MVFDVSAQLNRWIMLCVSRGHGPTVLAGMPAIPKTVDWTTIWYKELVVRGAYTYGVEDVNDERLRTFELALALAARPQGGNQPAGDAPILVRDYPQAIQTALFTGKHQAVKTVFEFTGGNTT